MKNWKRRMCAALAIATIPVFSGCSTLVLAGGAAVVGGGGYYLWSRGTYVAMLDASLFDSDSALSNVANRAQFIQLNRRCDGYGCFYIYQDLNAVKVRFRLKGVAPDATELHIRVGKVGDKVSSRAILKAVDEELQLARY